jgi:phosphatidylethanolamine/phosphatidyl-N-methylethanolamine N-methyltransferase
MSDGDRPQLPADQRDRLRFLRSWLASPLRTGAQMPSGRHLCRAMAEAVDPSIPGLIIELGPGTGPVTRALLKRGVEASRLVLVEANPEFCGLLRQRFPHCRVILGDALALPRIFHDSGEGPVAAVVSSLPLLVFPPRQRLRLLRDCFRLMGPAGRFVQFSYSARSPVPLRRAVNATASPRIWRNLWPAKVWSYAPVV